MVGHGDDVGAGALVLVVAMSKRLPDEQGAMTPEAAGRIG